MSLVVIKFGGSALELPQAAADFAADVVALTQKGIQPVIVHGGGKALSNFMTRLGLEPRFVEGLRYTDAATLELAQMVLAGKTNKDLVALINGAGGNAVGLCGSDGSIFVPEKISSPNGSDLGFVGEIKTVNPEFLRQLIAKGFIPVVCSVAHDTNGQALNINADHVAAELSRQLKVQDLILLTDVDGIKIDGALVRKLSLEEGKALLTHKDVSGGMRPKIEYALRAVSGGVAKAHIVNAATPGIVAKVLNAVEFIGTTLSKSE